MFRLRPHILPFHDAARVDTGPFSAAGLGVILPILMRLVLALSSLLCVWYRALPYTVHRVNAACFRAMGVDVLCDPLPCYPPRPYTLARLNAAHFGAVGVSVYCDPLLCCPPLYCG